MTLPKNVEEIAYQAVISGELKIDEQGRIWRVAARRWNRWLGKTVAYPCVPRRSEAMGNAYLQVHVMMDWKSSHASAHRLVWRHFHGTIPEGLTINHKNGVKTDNRPENLELATYAQQRMHALQVLGRKPKVRVSWLTVRGEKRTMMEWAQYSGMAAGTITARLKRGWSAERAIETPLPNRD